MSHRQTFSRFRMLSSRAICVLKSSSICEAVLEMPMPFSSDKSCSLKWEVWCKASAKKDPSGTR